MAMCVLLLIRSTSQFDSIGWTPTQTLRKDSAKWLKRPLDFGSYYVNSMAFLSQSRLSRCEDKFPELLTTDLSAQQVTLSSVGPGYCVACSC